MLPDTQVNWDTLTSPNQTPYAIVKLSESAGVIKQSLKELPAWRIRLEKNRIDKPKAREVYSELQNRHRRLAEALDSAALSLMEAELDEMAKHTVKLSQSIKSFNLMTPDYTKLCAVLNNYLSGLPLTDNIEDSGIFGISAGNTSDGDNINESQTTNNRIIGRLMNNVRMGYYPTCTDNMAHIIRGIEFPADTTINLFDPCCGCGLALRSLAEGALDYGSHNGTEVSCKTYGIELDSHRAEEALTRLDH